ncbi:MAG: protein O-mannosyl-transferase family [Anaerolineae bacterium]
MARLPVGSPDRWVAGGLFALGLALYTGTLAPTVLWGDGAGLQRQAALLELRGGALGHPLWVILAHALMRFPWGDMAWRANLLAALAGAGGWPLVYVLARREGASSWGGVAAAGMLGLSHTFWLHAVQAEVYTLLLGFWAAVLLALPTASTRQRAWRWGLAGFLWGLGLANHILLAALGAGLLAWLWAERGRRRDAASLAAGVGMGILPLCVFWAWTPPERVYAPLPEVLRGFLRSEAWRVGPRDLVLALGYLAYQFPLTGLLALPGVVTSWRRAPRRALAWGLWVIVPWVLALRHHVPDQYAFFLPAYLPVALWCGLGYDALVERLPDGWVGRGMLLSLCLALPVGTYWLASQTAARWSFVPLQVREIPGRDPWRFFLWPPKGDAWGARAYGEAALETAAPRALILADWTLQAPLEYLQDVERTRPDVLVVGTGDLRVPQVEFLRQACRDRPCYLADLHPYYDLAAIEEAFVPVPEGVLYRLVPKR